MNLKQGVYRSTNGQEIHEPHGGATLCHFVYSYLCLYYPDPLVGFYIAGENQWGPWFRKSFKYRGRIVARQSNDIVINIDDNFLNDRIVFEGTIDGDTLKLRMTRESDPATILTDDTFVLQDPTSKE